MKATVMAIIVSVVLIGGAFLFTKGGPQQAENNSAQNVSIVDGKQVIEISAKGGYVPVESTAKAGIPTVLRVDTNGTFDCSSSVRIPSMQVSQNLPASGKTDIDLGSPKIGLLQGTCSMGMYPFSVNFL